MEPAAGGNFSEQTAFLKKPQPWLLLATIMLGNGGLFCWYSYINPIMVEIAGFKFYAMAGIMMIAGGGMVLGNMVSGKLSNTFSPVYLTAGMIGIMFVSSLLMIFLAPYPYAALALMFAGVFGLFGVSGPEQDLRRFKRTSRFQSGQRPGRLFRRTAHDFWILGRIFRRSRNFADRVGTGDHLLFSQALSSEGKYPGVSL